MNNKIAKVNVFCCANSYDKLELIHSVDRQGIELKVISLPCSGKLDILYLTKTFETSADGAAVMICGEGECHYIEGNKRATKRAKAVGKLLAETGLGEGRIAVIQVNGSGTEQPVRDLEDFCLKIKALTKDSKEPVQHYNRELVTQVSR